MTAVQQQTRNAITLKGSAKLVTDYLSKSMLHLISLSDSNLCILIMFSSKIRNTLSIDLVHSSFSIIFVKV